MIAHFTFLTFFSLLVVTTVSTTENVKESRAPRSILSFNSHGSSLTRSQIFKMPNVVAVLFAVTFFLFLLPLRMLRLAPTTSAAQNQPNTKLKTQHTATPIPLTDEAAHLTRKILDAIETDSTCVNHTTCQLASDVKKIKNTEKQETIFNMLRILLPAKWKPSVEILKQATNAKQLDSFCHQFICEENDVDLVDESDDFQDEQTSTVDWVAAD